MKLFCAIVFAAAAALAVPAVSQTPAQDLEVARQVLENALKEHPRNAELHVLLGFVFRKMDRLDDSERSFMSAVEENPKKAEAHYMLGMIREKKGRVEEAKASWKACLKAATEPGMKETARRHLAVLEKQENQ